MAKPTYYELLKHPKWQEKRLRILERAEFSCEHCGDKESTLHVHHSFYTKGAKPWEYPDHSLIALCELCHNGAEANRADLYECIGLLSRDPSNIFRLRGYARCLQVEMDIKTEPRATHFELDPCEAPGVADYFGIPSWDVFTLAMSVDLVEDGFRVMDFHELAAMGRKP